MSDDVVAILNVFKCRKEEYSHIDLSDTKYKRRCIVCQISEDVNSFCPGECVCV